MLASASFGSLTVTFNAPASSCVPGIGPILPLTPFSFGVPQTYAVSLAVQDSSGGFVVARLSGFQFFDSSGNPITNAHFTLASVDMPEPSPLALLSITFMFFLAVLIRRMGFRGCFLLDR
jgi:hypothetical protein